MSVSDDEFIKLYKEFGAQGTAAHLGLNRRTVQRRRERIEKDRNIRLFTPLDPTPRIDTVTYPQRKQIRVDNGIVLIASDLHYWPKNVTTGHRAFVKFAYEMKPKVVVVNGDVTDFARISRHAPIGWENRPTVAEEINEAKARLAEIWQASPEARHVWTLGNHDARFETNLATHAPEYAKVHGVHLRDHFPDWEPAWTLWINDKHGGLVVKHRFKGGLHGAFNNAVYAGRSIATGHDHMLKVEPFTDYNGTRWGIDSGLLAEPYGPQFVDYTEDNPKNWRSGFIVLTFHKGKLLWPEIVAVHKKGVVDFRGQLIQV